jgi:hypothetical protein
MSVTSVSERLGPKSKWSSVYAIAHESLTINPVVPGPGQDYFMESRVIELVPPSTTGGARKVKNFKLCVSCSVTDVNDQPVNAEGMPFVYLMYSPGGMELRPKSDWVPVINPADPNFRHVLEFPKPGPYCMGFGINRPYGETIVIESPLCRNLNSGDTIVAVFAWANANRPAWKFFFHLAVSYVVNNG